MSRYVAAVALLTAALPTLASPAAAADEAQLARGRYLAAIMDCGGCHTPGSMTPSGPDASRALAGGLVGFAIPGLGVFFPPNLTPHETGLADWSAGEIAAAIVKGHRPDGRMLAPIMPSMAYAALSQEDLEALVAYLQNLPPIESPRLGPYGEGETVPAPYFALRMPQ